MSDSEDEIERLQHDPDEEERFADEQTFSLGLDRAQFLVEQLQHATVNGARTQPYGVLDSFKKDFNWGLFERYNPYQPSCEIPSVHAWARKFTDSVMEMVKDPYRLFTEQETSAINTELACPTFAVKQIRHASFGHNHALASLMARKCTPSAPAASVKELSVNYVLDGMQTLQLGALTALMLVFSSAKVEVRFTGNTAAMRNSAVRQVNQLGRKNVYAIDVGMAIPTADMVLAPKTLGHLLLRATMHDLCSAGFVVGSYFDPVLAAEVKTKDPLGPIDVSAFHAVDAHRGPWPHATVKDLITNASFEDPVVLPDRLHATGYCTSVYTLLELLKRLATRHKPSDFYLPHMSTIVRFVCVQELPGTIPDLSLLDTAQVVTERAVAFTHQEVNAPVALVPSELTFMGPSTRFAPKVDGVAGIFCLRDDAVAGQIGLPGTATGGFVFMSNGKQPNTYHGTTYTIQVEQIMDANGQYKIFPLEVTEIKVNGVPIEACWESRQAVFAEIHARWKPLFEVDDQGQLVSQLQTAVRSSEYHEGIILNPALMNKSSHILLDDDNAPQVVGVARHVKQEPTIDIAGEDGTVEVNSKMEVIRKRPGKKPNDAFRVQRIVGGATLTDLALFVSAYSGKRAVTTVFTGPTPVPAADKEYDFWTGTMVEPSPGFDPVHLMVEAAMMYAANKDEISAETMVEYESQVVEASG